MGMHNPFKHNRWKDDIFGIKKRARDNAKALNAKGVRKKNGVEQMQNYLDKWISTPDRRLFSLSHGQSRMEFGNGRSYL